MNIDQDYLKILLQSIQSFGATFTVRDLASAGYDFENDPKFEQHIRYLHDLHYIQQNDGGAGFGLKKGADGTSQWSIVALRLTASGQQFINA